jgi:hypothetical protein
LEWATVSETNNAGFEVQHLSGTQIDGTQDAGDWRLIAFVEGHGTTEAAHQYHYRIADLPPGRHRFRLRQVDFDGAFDYSPEVEVITELAQSFVMDAAYPNPFNETATVRFAVRQPQQVRLVLYDIQGRAVQTVYAGTAGSGQMQEASIDGSLLPNGVYLLRLEGEQFIEIQSITILR